MRAPRAAVRCAVLFLALLPQPSTPVVLKHWPLSTTLPIDDLSVDGSSAGPNGTVIALGLKGSSACHDPESTCNQLKSLAPHVFHVTWCADTRGFVGITCDLDLGYRSPEGARHGLLQYALRGRASGAADFTNASSVVFPDSPFPFDNFAVSSGKNDILTVFQLAMVEGHDAGDDLALTDTSGFCCRATFSGGKTVTGTLYVGDLKIRANGVVPSAAPTPSHSPDAPVADAARAAFSAAAVGGAAAGGGVLGGLVVAAALAALQLRATGALPAALQWSTPTRPLLGAREGERDALLSAARARSLETGGMRGSQ
jgi:hypothetical protein